MTFREFMSLYDNWNGVVRVNDDNLNTIATGNIFNVMVKRNDLHDKEVVAFGFYDGELTVRVK